MKGAVNRKIGGCLIVNVCVHGHVCVCARACVCLSRGAVSLTSRAAFANCLRLLLICKCVRLRLVSVDEKDGAWEGSPRALPVSREGGCLEYLVKSSTERGGEYE